MCRADGFTAHCYRLDPEPTTDMAADVEHSFAVLTPFGGLQTRYFRFPGGCYDTAALRAVAATHTTVVQYDDVADDPFNDDTDATIDGLRARATGWSTSPTFSTPVPRADADQLRQCDSRATRRRWTPTRKSRSAPVSACCTWST